MLFSVTRKIKRDLFCADTVKSILFAYFCSGIANYLENYTYLY